MIRLEQVAKHYVLPPGSAAGGGLFHAVKPTSLTIAAGERFGLIGFSGAGKSTLLRLINLLERPSSGSVWLDDQALSADDPAALRAARRQLGMVFQHFNLLNNRTVAGNVALPLELAGVDQATVEARVTEVLAWVGLADKAQQYPARLSGGQKQRVAIARALAPRPKVLLCDEPTSALDPLTAGEVVDVLRRVNAELGVTLVLVSHSIPLVRALCTRAAVMDGGEVIEELRFDGGDVEPRTEVARRLLAASGVAHV